MTSPFGRSTNHSNKINRKNFDDHTLWMAIKINEKAINFSISYLADGIVHMTTRKINT